MVAAAIAADVEAGDGSAAAAGCDVAGFGESEAGFAASVF
jgi:hypothetical protein